MKAKELKDINQSTRKMILAFMKDHDMTLNAFCKEAKLHQNQIWLYLYSGDDSKGVHSGTLQKLGEYMSSKKLVKSKK
jgi:hypothetical protein